MSASETIPQQAPLASTTGTRLMRFSSMMREHSSREISGVTVTTGVLMQSAAVDSSGLMLFATIRQTISRSVVTPIGILFLSTGISPQSLSTIIFATSGKGVSGAQHAGSAVMTSFTCIALYLHTEFRNLLDGRDYESLARGGVTTGVPTTIDSFSFVKAHVPQLFLQICIDALGKSY